MAATSTGTVVHLLRHGEVRNPEGILYGRRPGYHLSALGRAMAERVADSLAGSLGQRDIVHLASSPLERARETVAPLAELTGLSVETDPRLIESSNVFEGQAFGGGVKTVLQHPGMWIHLRNPFRPSWGEPYSDVVARMQAAVLDARAAAHGHEAVLVSHQLPIWVTRLSAERRPYLHDPRQRQCTLCSLTSFHFDERGLVRVSYSEPAGDLIPVRDKRATFSAGGAPEERRP
jgi:broad specificity phosphatase PhoE